MVAFAERIRLVAAADIVVQHVQRQRHQDNAAMAVDDRLGQARWCRWNRRSRADDRTAAMRARRRRPPARSRTGCPKAADRRLRALAVAMDDDMFDGRQRSAQFVDHLPPIMLPSRIGYAVAGDQHFWLDLLEAVDHRGRRHVRRTDAPDRADAGGGEKGDDGLRDVGQVGRDPIAGADAVRLEVDRERGDLAPQLRPARFPSARRFRRR